MDSNIQLGFQLLLVGMVSVFFILSIVILIGKMLITVANKYANEQDVIIMPKKPSRNNNQHIAAITAVVDFVTEGRGNVESIKKL